MNILDLILGIGAIIFGISGFKNYLEWKKRKFNAPKRMYATGMVVVSPLMIIGGILLILRGLKII